MTDISTRSPGDLNQPAGYAGTATPSPADTSTTQKAAAAGSNVASSVKEQGGQVAQETGRQARDLYHQARAEVGEQVAGQQKCAVGSLYSFADELAKMANDSNTSGPAHSLARQASNRINTVAGWLEHRKPGHVLDDVTAYARRKPGMFLLGAAVLGTVAGRLSKNLIGASTDSTGTPTTGGPSTSPVNGVPMDRTVDSWADPHTNDDPQYDRP